MDKRTPDDFRWKLSGWWRKELTRNWNNSLKFIQSIFNSMYQSNVIFDPRSHVAWHQKLQIPEIETLHSDFSSKNVRNLASKILKYKMFVSCIPDKPSHIFWVLYFGNLFFSLPNDWRKIFAEWLPMQISKPCRVHCYLSFIKMTQ